VVDFINIQYNGDKLVEVPAGFEVAPGDANDLSVCGAHPWQSNFLSFADGGGCGTTQKYAPGDFIYFRKANRMFSVLRKFSRQKQTKAAEMAVLRNMERKWQLRIVVVTCFCDCGCLMSLLSSRIQ
jgi:hypothetical protein